MGSSGRCSRCSQERVYPVLFRRTTLTFPCLSRHATPASDREPPCTGFGHQFKSASDARRRSMASHRLELPPREFEVTWEDHLSTHPPFILASASAIDGHHPIAEETPPVVEALSPTEEAMFHVLCADPEWDAVHSPTEEEHPGAQDADAGEEANVSPFAPRTRMQRRRGLSGGRSGSRPWSSRGRARGRAREARARLCLERPAYDSRSRPPPPRVACVFFKF
ncbi:hypothetical protein BD413DRAFT_21346 [Trametes elegans]|nr:hypothetical protein BD413DRAFT_21346 [Trametes elegans]